MKKWLRAHQRTVTPPVQRHEQIIPFTTFVCQLFMCHCMHGYMCVWVCVCVRTFVWIHKKIKFQVQAISDWYACLMYFTTPSFLQNFKTSICVQIVKCVKERDCVCDCLTDFDYSPSFGLRFSTLWVRLSFLYVTFACTEPCVNVYKSLCVCVCALCNCVW